MINLKPCPLCGSTDIKFYTTDAKNGYRDGHIKCNSCGCRVKAASGGWREYKEIKDHKLIYKLANDEAKMLVTEKWNNRKSGE